MKPRAAVPYFEIQSRRTESENKRQGPPHKKSDWQKLKKSEVVEVEYKDFCEAEGYTGDEKNFVAYMNTAHPGLELVDFKIVDTQDKEDKADKALPTKGKTD